MTSERSQAYRRVLRTLSELGPSKLQTDEQDRIRHAADNLIFASNLCVDDAALDALADTDALCATLVASGRWEPVTAACLERDLRACGPSEDVAAAA